MPMSTKELQIRAPPANFTEKRLRLKKGISIHIASLGDEIVLYWNRANQTTCICTSFRYQPRKTTDSGLREIDLR